VPQPRFGRTWRYSRAASAGRGPRNGGDQVASETTMTSRKPGSPARWRRWLAAAALLLAAFAAAPARAHPHVWVTAKSELVFNADGAITAVRHAWTFDDMFSTYALQGLETKTKGVYTREELAPLAQTNVESLQEFGFFTFARSAEAGPRRKQKFNPPVDYYLEHADGVLTLHFTLPLQSPLPAKGRNLVVEIYDPTYFVDFALAKDDPVKLVGAPAGCKLALERPSDGTAQAQRLGEDNFLSGAGANFGANFANKVSVECP
jgi:ABC-type uncharacterized transport system substrate-binding protein